jgi:anti-sigma factor RsiW
MSGTALTGTLRRLLGPGEPEVTCDVCFDQLDVYVDAEVLGDDAGSTVPGMAAHLAGCPACADEHDSLKALVTTGEL